MTSETANYIEKGNEKLDQGKSAEAVKYFDEALKLEPHNDKAYVGKCLALIELGKVEEALNCFDEVLKFDQTHIWPYCVKSSILMDLGRYKEAKKCIDQGLQLEPQNVYALNLKGLILSNSGKKNLAIGYFDDALKIDPNLFEALKNKGITLFWIDKYKEAINSLKKALNMEPTDEDVLIYLGWSLVCLDKYSEGIKYYNKVLSLNNQNYEAMYRKASALTYTSKKEDALKYLDEALEVEPELINVLILKAEIYRDMKKPEKALECYEKASKIDPKNPDPWVGKGNVLRGMEKKEEAVKAYEKFVETIRENKLSDRNLEAHRVSEYINWIKKGEPITFSPKNKPQYWQWSTKAEYFLENDGGERKVLEPKDSFLGSDPGRYWTCHKDTRAGDLILLYRAGKKNGTEYMDIKYLLMARSDAYPLDDLDVEEGWDYGCDYIPLFKFRNSLKLSEMKEEPYLEGWNALGANFHRKVYRTKEQYWKRLNELLIKKNPDYADFMKKFDRKKIIAKIKTEKEFEDNLEENIHVLKKFGYDLEVVSRQEICTGDNGRMDLLCKDTDGGYVVVELKINKANRDVFGQISEYLGWVMDHKSNGEPVKGIVISRGYDKKFQSALKTNPNVEHIQLVDVVSELGMKLK